MAEEMTYSKAIKIMSSEEDSQMVVETKQQHVKLSPKHICNVKQGVSEIIKSNLLVYNKEMEGVPIAFQNIKSLAKLGRILGDQPCIHMDVVADFVIFRPTVGSMLKGIINKVGPKHLGCLVHECFNAWVPRPADVEDTSVLIGQEIVLTIKDTFSNNNVMSIKGDFVRFTSYKPQSVAEDVSIGNDVVECIDKAGKKKKKHHKTLEIDNNALNDSLESLPASSSQLDPPLMSSTVIEHSQTPKKKEKKKKRKSQHIKLEDISETSTSVCDVSTTDGSKVTYSVEVSKNSASTSSVSEIKADMDETVETGSERKHKKKKKKHNKSKNKGEMKISIEIIKDKSNGSAKKLGKVNIVSTSDNDNSKVNNRKRKLDYNNDEDNGKVVNDFTEMVSPKKKVKKMANDTEVNMRLNTSSVQIKTEPLTIIQEKKHKKKKKNNSYDNESSSNNINNTLDKNSHSVEKKSKKKKIKKEKE